MIAGVRLSLTATLLCLGVIDRPARAEKGDPISVVLSDTVLHDSNLFKIPDFANAQAVLGKDTRSEVINVASVGLNIDKTYGPQRFQLDLTRLQLRYHNFPHLNFDTLDYRAAWLWSLARDITGTLSTDRKSALVPFSETSGAQRNVREVDKREFTFDARVLAGWHVLLGASRFKQASENPALVTDADFQMEGPEVGIKYEIVSGNSVSLTRRSLQGTYLRGTINPVTLTDNAFHQEETKVAVKWSHGGPWSVNGHLGWTERHHEHFPQRDFAQPIADVTLTWAYPGKLNFDLLVKRDVAATTNATTSYRITDVLSLTTVWQPTARATVRLVVDRTASQFQGPILPAPGPLREDTTRSAKLIADWIVTRKVTANASLGWQARSGNDPALQYDAKTVSIGAILTF